MFFKFLSNADVKSTFRQKILYVLNIAGCCPETDNVFAKIRRSVLMVSFSITIALFILETLLNFRGINTFAKAVEASAPVITVLWKYYCLIYKRSEMIRLIENSNRFWSASLLRSEQAKEANSMFKITLRLFVAFYLSGWLAILNFLNDSFRAKERHTLLLSYGDQDGLTTPYFELIVAVQLTYFILGINMAYGFDGLFFYFVSSAISELKVIKIVFSGSKLPYTYWKDIHRFDEALKHHMEVLRYIQDLNQLYGNFMLQQFLAGMCAICFAIFMMTIDGMPPSTEKLSKYTNLILAYMIQLGQYCVAGAFLIEESAQVGDTVFYESLRGKINPKNKFRTIMIIQRCQKITGISIGGFGMLNLESFTLVVQNSLSFFTFLQAVYMRSD